MQALSHVAKLTATNPALLAQLAADDDDDDDDDLGDDDDDEDGENQSDDDLDGNDFEGASGGECLSCAQASLI